MASEKITAIVEELKTLTVLELSELVKAVEDEFGVSAAAAVAVAAPVEAAPAADVDVIETPQKKTSSIFDDPDEDESDILPVFKGRNIFGNN